jgi:beta-lactamase family protein
MTVTLSPGPPVIGGLIGSRQAAGAAIIRNFQVAWSGASAGAADLLFQAGSISKPVTALAALELAARGQVSLDGDVNDYLTSWQVPGPPVLSLRQVLDGAPPAVTAAVRPSPARRDEFRYSGGGYAIIQQLISDVTATPFDEAARTLALEPRGPWLLQHAHRLHRRHRSGRHDRHRYLPARVQAARRDQPRPALDRLPPACSPAPARAAGHPHPHWARAAGPRRDLMSALNEPSGSTVK